MTAQMRPSADLNVTPMIDVLLVLLIMFMVLVVGGRRAMDVQLPEECRAGCAAGDAIVLEVLPGGEFRLNQRHVVAPALPRVLAETYAGRPDKVLSVVGRPGVAYRDVIEAMDVARASGVRVLSVVPGGL